MYIRISAHTVVITLQFQSRILSIVVYNMSCVYDTLATLKMQPFLHLKLFVKAECLWFICLCIMWELSGASHLLLIAFI